MANGNTTTGSLADSLETIIDNAMLLREFPGVMSKVVERQTLKEGTGLSWEEVELAHLTAQGVTESTVLDNPQQIVDSLRTITPTISGITTIVTDRAAQRITPQVAGQMGKLASQALERKKDQDGLTTLDGFGTSLSGAGTTLDSGVIAAAARRISGNTTSPSMAEKFTVLHPFQLHDIQTEVVSGVGTYTVPAGISADFFQKGFSGTLYGTNVYEDGNLTIDASDDAKGGVFSKEAIILVQGHSLRTEMKRRQEIGGGADQMFMYDEYAYGERTPNGSSVWGYEIYSDALAPTA